jgi:hypothetical protein
MLKSVNLLDFVRPDFYFNIYNTRPYWKKYINKVNMTKIDCNLGLDKYCLIPESNHKLFTVTTTEDVSIRYIRQN